MTALLIMIVVDPEGLSVTLNILILEGAKR